MGERIHWGLEALKPATLHICPLCGANQDGPHTDEYDVQFECGTHYIDGKCLISGVLCQGQSQRTKRRLSNILGILTACDPYERMAIIGGIKKWCDEQS